MRKKIISVGGVACLVALTQDCVSFLIVGIYADKYVKRVAWQFVFWRVSEGAGSS